MIKKIGYWNQFRESRLPSLYDDLLIDLIRPNLLILEYLKKGIKVSGLRTIVYCVLTGDKIGSPYDFTDGIYVWTGEFVFYYEQGMVNIPCDFKKSIENLSYQVPSKEQIGIEKLIAIGDGEY